MIRLLRLRRLVQVAVLLLLAALPWLNRDGFTGMKGSLFAFDFFGLPFSSWRGSDRAFRHHSGLALDSRCACCARRRTVPWAHLLFMVLPFRVLVRTRTRHPGQTSPKAAQTRISVPGRDRACRAGACAPARLSAAQPAFPARRPVPWLSDRRRSALLQNNPHRSGASPLLCRAVSARDYCARRRACHGRTALVPLGLSAVRPARADGPPARGPASAAHAVPLYLQRRTRLPPRLLARP